MSESVSISTGIASRYATAVFELAKEGKMLPALERDVDALDQALSESADLREMIGSPILARAQQTDAISAISEKMKLSPIVANSLRLMATKKRLFVLPQLVQVLRGLIAQEKGEVTADVISAKALTKAQQDKLMKSLKEGVGEDIKLNLAVDESLIGGLVVKVGSKMIDTSIRSKLNALQNSMKEVG